MRSRRTAANPFVSLSKLNAETDRRRVRRETPDADFAKLLQASRAGGTFRGLTGADRAMLYTVATSTGLRASELASLTRSSLDLNPQSPTVTVEAAYSKRRRRDVQPIRPELAEALRLWLQEREQAAGDGSAILPLARPSDAKLWPGTWPQKAAPMLRRDLEAAGIPYVDERGRVRDFHSLRHTFGSNLSRAGVSPKVAQELMRHWNGYRS